MTSTCYPTAPHTQSFLSTPLLYISDFSIIHRQMFTNTSGHHTLGHKSGKTFYNNYALFSSNYLGLINSYIMHSVVIFIICTRRPPRLKCCYLEKFCILMLQFLPYKYFMSVFKRDSMVQNYLYSKLLLQLSAHMVNEETLTSC